MKFLVALLLGLGFGLWSHGRFWTIADDLNPWAPLTYEARPDWLTRFKVQRFKSDPAACQAFMSETPWRFQAVADRDTGPGCGLRNAIHVQQTSVAVGPAFTLSCPAAASLALWERHVLQPAAQATLGANVQRLEHLGSYACRNVYGREAGNRSQHATANALDIAGFVLEDGRRITVVRQWRGDTPASAFLREVHQGACRFFDGVLGPEYNQAHADHFHFDSGRHRICR
ncbi:extensin family protein [Pantoea sp. 18069]|uniref:extensin-like domain-containing protein n=1 Tax=Pantoea sp. 18069 TaxID=2681415 RepID=UPI0013594A96|nr:extensin family protein [Pantoea sp. 18069]